MTWGELRDERRGEGDEKNENKRVRRKKPSTSTMALKEKRKMKREGMAGEKWKLSRKHEQGARPHNRKKRSWRFEG